MGYYAKRVTGNEVPSNSYGKKRVKKSVQNGQINISIVKLYVCKRYSQMRITKEKGITDEKE